jgi:MFS family permease
MLQPRNSASDAPRRGLLPPALALAGGATTFTSLYLSAGALTPLLVAYRVRWDFPPSLLTVAFAVYALGFVAALLVFGPLSDHVGRRPVIIGALAIQLVSNVLFLVAPDVGWVVVGRIVQGIGTGAATSALTALLAEVSPQHRRLGTILGSVSVTGGLAVGSLLAGLALQLTASANTLIFTVLIIVTVLGVVVVLLSPESATRAPGALRSLVPRVAVPRISRPEFVAAAPVIAAVWMLAGLSGGLAPSMVSSVFRLHSDFVNGFSGFVAPAVSAIAGLALGGVRPRATMFIGLATAVVGPALIIVGALGGSLVVMTLGQGVSGFAFGAAFTASLRLIVPLAPAHQRAAVVASVYTVAYLAFGIAVVAAGYLGGVIGVVASVTLYAAVTVLLAVLSVIGQVRIVAPLRTQSTTEKELS